MDSDLKAYAVFITLFISALDGDWHNLQSFIAAQQGDVITGLRRLLSQHVC